MRIFVLRDLDGFFGLFVDNLVQLLLIVALCEGLCGMTGDNAYLLYRMILPGAAVSLVIGNAFYAWQAHRLARRTGRTDVTALPYGINTPSLLIYVFFVMAPVYRSTGSAEQAWRMGLLACLGSGLIEFSGAFVAESIRRRTPRAALLSTLAGIAIGFISMTFALEIWTRPLVAMVPLALVLVTYFSHIRFPLGLPGGLIAIVSGAALAWCLPAEWSGVVVNVEQLRAAWEGRGLAVPVFCGEAVWSVLSQPASWVPFLSVIIPMGLFNVLGSLQNIESAEAAGDPFATRPSLAMNGVGSICAAFFGSCFPTTIYIGHPGWKALGARAGYSTLNGIVVTVICLTGTVALVKSVVPIEAGIAIVLWIGIIITAQAFAATPTRHAAAVAIGLFPAIAAWGATVAQGAFLYFQQAGAGQTMQAFLDGWRAGQATGELNGYLLHGLVVMERGYIFTCMIMAALSACLIDRQFFLAAVWSLVGFAATAVGLCHAYQLSGNQLDYLLLGTTPAAGSLTYRAVGIAVGYLLMAAVFVLIGWLCRAKAIVDQAGDA